MTLDYYGKTSSQVCYIIVVPFSETWIQPGKNSGFLIIRLNVEGNMNLTSRLWTDHHALKAMIIIRLAKLSLMF